MRESAITAVPRGQDRPSIAIRGTPQCVVTNEASLCWREDGHPSGVPVLFLNSLGTDMRLWDATVLGLPPYFRAIRMDLRGHGLSSGRVRSLTISDLADDAVAVLDAAGVGTAIIVGLSVGGMVAQDLATRHASRVRAAALVCTAPRMGTPALWNERIEALSRDGMEPVADRILERWFAPSFLERPEVAIWRAMLTRTPKEGYVACCDAIANVDLTQTVARIDRSVLAIAGENDGACPPDEVRAMAEAIPNARFSIINGVGHLPCVEDPVSFGHLLHPFLEEHA